MGMCALQWVLWGTPALLTVVAGLSLAVLGAPDDGMARCAAPSVKILPLPGVVGCEIVLKALNDVPPNHGGMPLQTELSEDDREQAGLLI